MARAGSLYNKGFPPTDQGTDAAIAANVTALPAQGAGAAGLAFGYRAVASDGVA